MGALASWREQRKGILKWEEGAKDRGGHRQNSGDDEDLGK